MSESMWKSEVVDEAQPEEQQVEQAADRTLREEELQEFQARVVEAVGKVGARLRS